MRPKVITTILLLAIAVLAVTFLTSKALHRPGASPSNDDHSAPPQVSAGNESGETAPSSPASSPTLPLPLNATSELNYVPVPTDPVEREKYIRQRKRELTVLAMGTNRSGF